MKISNDNVEAKPSILPWIAATIFVGFVVRVLVQFIIIPRFGATTAAVFAGGMVGVGMTLYTMGSSSKIQRVGLSLAVSVLWVIDFLRAILDTH